MCDRFLFPSSVIFEISLYSIVIIKFLKFRKEYELAHHLYNNSQTTSFSIIEKNEPKKILVILFNEPFLSYFIIIIHLPSEAINLRWLEE